MILLVTPNARRDECATALREATGIEVSIADSLRQATTLLRSGECVCVVLDQYLLEFEEKSALMEHLGTAIPVQVNLAISAMERVVREVQLAVLRRKQEELIARRAAQESLQNELNSTVTALLLNCDLAIAVPDLPAPAADKLHITRELLDKLRTQLDARISRN